MFFDWQESVITHPFFCVLNLFEDSSLQDQSGVNAVLDSIRESEERKKIELRFLEQFSTYGSRERLNEAFSIARSIHPIVKLKRWFDNLEKLEQNSFWAWHIEIHLKLWSRYYISKQRQASNKTPSIFAFWSPYRSLETSLHTYLDRDFIGHHGRIMRDMQIIAEYQLKGVSAG